MKKEKKEKDFVHKPVYPGGRKAMRKFLKKELRYPLAAREARVEGTVYLKYTIDYLGKVIDAKVISGPGYGCDEEAIRLVKCLQFEIARNRKLKVQFHKSIQIHFRLPKPGNEQKKASPAGGIQYQYVPSRKNPDDGTPDADTSGYSYTIEW